MAPVDHACGATRITVKLLAMSGDEHNIDVTRDTPLRDVQAEICRIFRKSFPATKVCIAVGNRTYEEFIELPFAHCLNNDVLTVVPVNTDDPYVHDVRDRRKRSPHQPPPDLERGLAASPLDLSASEPLA